MHGPEILFLSKLSTRKLKAKGKTSIPYLHPIKQHNGTLTHDPKKICCEFQKCYTTLYKTKHINEHNEVIQNFLSETHIRKLSEAQINSMNALVGEEEVLRVISQQKPGKAPGPDGLTGLYYKKFEDILGPHLFSIFQAILKGDKIPEISNLANIVVIPKQGRDPQEWKNYRLISLINVYIKILM